MTLSSLLLHRYHQGELSPDERAQVRNLIDSDPEAKRRYQALLASEAELAVQPLPHFIQELDRPAPPRRSWLRWFAIGTPAVGFAVAALSLLLVMNPTAGQVEPELVDDVLTKGDRPDLEVWVQGENGPRVHEDQALGDGDVVQLKYDARGARFVTLAGRDSTGEIEIYRSIQQGDDTHGLQTSPFSLTLDDTPGTQEFFVLAHDDTLDALEIEDRILTAGEDLRSVRIPKR